MYFARLKVESCSAEVDLDFVSWELQIDLCLCGAVRKRHTELRTAILGDSETREAGD